MMEIPKKTSEYLSPTYWNERFKTEESYEWLGEYENFAPILRRYLEESSYPQPQTCLVVGNGNSTMGQSLALDSKVIRYGAQTVSITDISPVVVSKSREKAGRDGGKVSRTSWAVCDMLCLPYRDKSLDLIVEKGAMDVLEVDGGKDPWHPNPKTLERMHAWLAEAHRVLSDQGVLVSISFAQPHFRRLLFDSQGYTWIVETESYTTTLGSTENQEAQGGCDGSFWEYFIYFARKGARSPSLAHQRESGVGDRSEADRKGCKEDYEHEILDQEDFLFRIGCQGDDDEEEEEEEN